MTIQVGDLVKVIGDADFRGTVGKVIEVIDGWDYPYNVEFGHNVEFGQDGCLLYAEEELEVVE